MAHPSQSKVLLAVHSAVRGGAQLMALKDAQHLSRDHELIVSIPRGPLREDFARVGSLTRCSPSLPVWTTSPGPWAIRLVRSLLDALRLTLLIRRRGIHAVMVNSIVLASPVLAARLARVPVIVHARETPTTAAGKLTFTFHARLATTVICVSQAVEEHLPRRRRARVVRVPDGVDIPLDTHIRAEEFQSPLRLCVVGSLNGAWSKGQDVAVDAVGRLAVRGLEASLEIVGPVQDRRDAERLLMQASRLGVADRVYVLGATDRVDEVITRSDIVLACSRVEPLGLVPAEALARCRPVIASRTGGLPEVVRDGETGVLVPPGDAEALADAVAALAADPAAARAMAACGREDVKRRFDTRVARSHVAKELARLLSVSAPQAAPASTPISEPLVE